MNISIKECEPAGALKPFIDTYWYGTFNIINTGTFNQNVIPNGFIELIIHLDNRHCLLYSHGNWSKSPDYTLIGLHTKPYDVRFDHKVRVFGVRFKPEGIYNLFRIPASEFAEIYIDLESMIGKSFSNFSRNIRERQDHKAWIRTANEYFLERLQRNGSDLYYLNWAAENIRNRNGLIRMDELADISCISSRQLEREFKDKIGITPKQYIRISRLNEVFRHIQNPVSENLTSISYLAGFADQAHFIREFKAFSGISPLKFMKNREEYIVNN